MLKLIKTNVFVVWIKLFLPPLLKWDTFVQLSLFYSAIHWTVLDCIWTLLFFFLSILFVELPKVMSSSKQNIKTMLVIKGVV